MSKPKYNRPTKDSVKRAREILDKMRTPIIPSDELVSIVYEITKITNPDKPDSEKDEVAASPATDMNQ